VANIAEIVTVASLFPRFVEDNQNDHLIDPVTREELKEIVYSFQREKVQGPMVGPSNSI